MNRKLVFFFASALAIAGCAKEPQADNSAVSDASDANFSLVASSDVFTKTELQGTTIHWKSGGHQIPIFSSILMKHQPILLQVFLKEI